MRVSPQDDVRIIAARAEVNRANLEHLQQNREANNKASIESQIKKAQAQQDKFIRVQFQKLLDNIYFEKGQQSARVLKGTNVDVYA
jgi:hypothetical protein